MSIGVAICTLNRADRLERVLGSLVEIVDAPVLIVDNGSTDRTAQVVESFTARCRHMCSVVEETAGLSNARNRALSVLDTDYVAFLDDDVVVQPGWLEAIRSSLLSEPSPAGIAGRIDLHWEAPRRRWSVDVPLVDAQLAGLDLGALPRILLPHETPYGANMVLNREMCDMVGGFRSHLGRRGRSLMSMEEVELVTRIRKVSDRPFVWCPDAVVRHVVPEERATFRYHVRRSFAQGKSEAVLAGVGVGFRPSTETPWRSVLQTAVDGIRRPERARMAKLAMVGAYAAGRLVGRGLRVDAT